jgi:hypothetical protein
VKFPQTTKSDWVGKLPVGLVVGCIATTLVLGAAGQLTLAHDLPSGPSSATHVANAGEPVAFDSASREPITPIESIALAAPATRTSFLAHWEPVPYAVGYRLDVSTSSDFRQFVQGYCGLEVGNVTARIVTGLERGATYYYRVHSYTVYGSAGVSSVGTAATTASNGLIINPTFDSSIVNSPNSAVIQATINQAIAIYEALFSDPITIQIYFRYTTTNPNGDPLPSNNLARSNYVTYTSPWNTVINAMKADAKGANDTTATASLPASALSSNLTVSSANGRALGLNTPPAMFSNGTVSVGAPYDGIVTVNSSQPFQFTRPPGAAQYDAMRSIEHEMDEIMGFGALTAVLVNDCVQDNLRPQDLFSWSSPGTRNLCRTGNRYFSINGGNSSLVDFNQVTGGDYGDWASGQCPQATPYVQNAFSCANQYSDVTATSPEGIGLDVIGYNLANVTASTQADLNGDGIADIIWQSASTGQAVIWFMNGQGREKSSLSLPAANYGDYRIVGIADVNSDGTADVIWQSAGTGQVVIWFMDGQGREKSSLSFPAANYGDYRIVGAADLNSDGLADIIWQSSSTGQAVAWFMDGQGREKSSLSFPTGNYGDYRIVDTADLNSDGLADIIWQSSSTGQAVTWFMDGQGREKSSLSFPTGNYGDYRIRP